MLFTVGLDSRGAKFAVRSFACHPGSILTELNRAIPKGEFLKFCIQFGDADEQGSPILNPLRQSKPPGQGAATTVWAATSPLLNGAGGLDLENCNVAPMAETLTDVDLASQTDPRGFSGVKSWAINAGSADKLWALSEKLTGVKFPF
jgi:hypothetical protein